MLVITFLTLALDHEVGASGPIRVAFVHLVTVLFITARLIESINLLGLTSGSPRGTWVSSPITGSRVGSIDPAIVKISLRTVPSSVNGPKDVNNGEDPKDILNEPL